MARYYVALQVMLLVKTTLIGIKMHDVQQYTAVYSTNKKNVAVGHASCSMHVFGVFHPVCQFCIHTLFIHPCWAVSFSPVLSGLFAKDGSNMFVVLRGKVNICEIMMSVADSLLVMSCVVDCGFPRTFCPCPTPHSRLPGILFSGLEPFPTPLPFSSSLPH